LIEEGAVNERNYYIQGVQISTQGLIGEITWTWRPGMEQVGLYELPPNFLPTDSSAVKDLLEKLQPHQPPKNKNNHSAFQLSSGDAGKNFILIPYIKGEDGALLPILQSNGCNIGRWAGPEVTLSYKTERRKCSRPEKKSGLGKFANALVINLRGLANLPAGALCYSVKGAQFPLPAIKSGENRFGLPQEANATALCVTSVATNMSIKITKEA
jgi:hypothetical protein